ncbi:unnamed protein product [Rotaria sp. Silwood2]|nr:unnamed protein product [Rotaria sp. Silwood2]CAF3150126.1 unnamed protein product [Rotaria sp. Silwood2]CAF3449388.1 unnamed protein product [Rotaria sp. Silwood2]
MFSILCVNSVEVAEHLSKVGKPYGSIVKIELSASTVINGHLDFVISFDNAQSGKNFCEGATAINDLGQSILFFNLTYTETPRQNN